MRNNTSAATSDAHVFFVLLLSPSCTALTSVVHLSNRLASTQQAAPPPSVLHVLPKTSALHCCDPITLSRLQTDTKNITLWENASLPVCCPSLYIFITCCGLQENWFDSPLCDDTAVCDLRSAFAHLPYLLLCLGVCVCVCWVYWGK